jgi:hypothetical protein
MLGQKKSSCERSTSWSDGTTFYKVPHVNQPPRSQPAVFSAHEGDSKREGRVVDGAGKAAGCGEAHSRRNLLFRDLKPRGSGFPHRDVRPSRHGNFDRCAACRFLRRFVSFFCPGFSRSRRRTAGEITQRDFLTVRSRLHKDKEYWALIDVGPIVLSQAEDLVQKTGVRTLDALHVASVLTFQASSALTIPFVTRRCRQREAAESLALNLIWIESRSLRRDTLDVGMQDRFSLLICLYEYGIEQAVGSAIG